MHGDLLFIPDDENGFSIRTAGNSIILGKNGYSH